MRTKDELKLGVASMLHDLRIKHNLSKAAMARKLHVDDHTWNAWETGKSAPSIIEFITIFDACGESILQPMLKFLFPEQYSLNETELRDELVHFTQKIASDHAIDIMHYLAFGDHGSNFHPQIELMCAYNHLPLEQRFLVAELVYTGFLTSLNRDDLVAKESVMPDMLIWEEGLRKAQRAAYKHLQSYNTITEIEE